MQNADDTITAPSTLTGIGYVLLRSILFSTFIPESTEILFAVNFLENWFTSEIFFRFVLTPFIRLT